ncbi:hypothetical protein TRFO_23046 [Tritrichomonas foetus]|uniref:L-type lectin-like domain-containing protein n=1 Tax=Tritrichomonas foetus TaxID=1144522 RepID=A0A1J4KFA0_9EUKA|nr:hypothetical protein TRFO_23046 [Tritrichomonas foetus]|eukprot:OHT08444.1 hypothetical protein TRFO_23046 [Tritrichomonas foetus]
MFSFFLFALIKSQDEFGPPMGKLIKNVDSYSGSWEISNDSDYVNNQIVLIPENSTTGRGYAWRLRRPPNNTWDASFRFKVSNISKSAITKIGVYLTEDFGASGSCFGGPCIFHGVAVMAQIYHGMLTFEVRRNDGTINYTKSSILPTMDISSNCNEFTITVQNLKENFIKIFTIVNGKNDVLHMGPIYIPYEKNWFSITADNNKTINEVVLTHARTSFKDEVFNFNEVEYDGFGQFSKEQLMAESNNNQPASVSEFDPESGLNHTEFSRISRVLVRMKNNRQLDINADAILEGIIEIYNVLNLSCTMKSTTEVIQLVVHPFTDSWARRIYSAVEETGELREELSNQLKSAEKALNAFKGRLFKDFTKLNTTIEEIQHSLIENIQNSSKIVDVLKKKERVAKGSKLVQFLTYFAIIEVVGTIAAAFKYIKTARH